MRTAFVVLLACLPSFAMADPGAWSQWRGDSRDGQLAQGTLPTGLSDRMELVWEQAHGPSYSGPVVRNGLVYTTETVDKKSERVTAYRVADGSKVWSKEWPGAMTVPFFAASNGSWIRATPAVSDDALVVVGIRDLMVSLDPKTGDELWRMDFAEALGSSIPQFGAACSPLIDGDNVYFQANGAVVCLSAKDGSVKWKGLQQESTEGRGAFSSPMIATIAGQRQLLVQTRLKLCGVDLESGKVFWSQPIEAFRGMNILTPLVIGDRVFTSAHSGRAQMFEVSRNGDQWSVEEIWQQKQQAYMSSPVVASGKIYLQLRNDRMTALNADTGDEYFTTKPIGKYASMITDGTRVLALTNRGELMLIDSQSDDFEVIDKVQVADDSWAHVALSGEYLIIRDLGKLKIYRLKA